jgi:outer membrane protein OmpA-like peptidoglycan-associated protein
MAMSVKRFACLVLVIAVAALGCANGRPAPLACALVGQVGLATAGVVAGDENAERIGYGVAGAVVGSVAGWYLCKWAQKEEPPRKRRAAAPAPSEAPTPPEAMPGAVQEKIVLRGVNFDFDKSEIRADAAVVLDEVVTLLSDKPDVQVRVEGHTDATGPDAYNQGLSERRAASVRKYLVDHGIEASRLTSVGFGESSPIAANDTREGRALNRRVELKVME